MQNTPNPDVNSPTVGNDSNTAVEKENEEMPTPPDRAPNVPVEEPPEIDQPAIEDEGNAEPTRIL